MVSLKKMIAGMFDFFGDFKQDPLAAIILCIALLLAVIWWVLFVFPVVIPLSALKDWSKTPGKSLWKSYKDNFRGPVQ